MSLVNPKLAIDPRHSVGELKKSSDLRGAISELFGSADPVIVRAVIDFLKKSPGDLDHHNLRTVAAAARSFDDKNHVAHMISQLPVTQMKVAVKAIDVTAAAAEFDVVLRRFRPETSRKLVLDLINTSTIQVLEDSPHERVPEPGRKMVTDHLVKMAKRRDVDGMALVEHRHVTSEVAAAVLDRIETQLDRQAADDELDPSQALRVLTGVFRESHRLSEPVIDQAWRLLQRLPEEESAYDTVTDTYRAIRTAAANDTSAKVLGGRIFEWAERDDHAEQSIGDQLLNARVPEALAMQIAQRVVSSNRVAFVETALGAVRLHHYLNGGTQLPELNKEQLDLLSAQLPIDRLNVKVIEEVETPEALRMLAARGAELMSSQVAALLKHPALEPPHVELLLEQSRDRPLVMNRYDDPWGVPIPALLSSTNLDDAQLATVATRAAAQFVTDGDRRMLLMRAVCNRSSGEQVWRLFADEMKSVDALSSRSLAENSASDFVHQKLATLAAERGDNELAELLMSNGTLRAHVWEQLKRDFPNIDEPTQVTLQAPRRYLGGVPYDVNDVVAVALEGQAPPHRIEVLGRGLTVGSRERKPDPTAQAARQLADAGLLTEGLVDNLDQPDRHRALELATHPLCPSDQGKFVTLCESQLSETANAMSDPRVEVPPEKGLRSWKQLPNGSDMPLTETAVTRALEGQMVDGLVLQMPKTPRQLEDLSAEMHNCLNGYMRDVVTGRSVVVYVRDDNEIYAALYGVLPGTAGSSSSGIRLDDVTSTGGRWNDDVEVRLGFVEINSKFNQGQVPDAFKRELASTIEKFNNGTLPPVEPTLSVEQDPPAVEPARPAIEQARPAVEPELPPVEQDPSAVEPARPAVRVPPRRTRALVLPPERDRSTPELIAPDRTDTDRFVEPAELDPMREQVRQQQIEQPDEHGNGHEFL